MALSIRFRLISLIIPSVFFAPVVLFSKFVIDLCVYSVNAGLYIIELNNYIITNMLLMVPQISNFFLISLFHVHTLV